MSQVLIVLASSIFLVLGALHGWLTLRDLQAPISFTPPDPALRRAMQESAIRLNPEVNLWKAWIGFNFTHSLGLVLFGGAFLYVGVFDAEAYRASLGLRTVAVATSAAYLVLSWLYFFSTPAAGSAVGLVLFLLAAIA